MAQDGRHLLELLKFELRFLEDGGYGRSPHAPWRQPLIFEDSPTCPNFRDPARPHACNECQLMEFVPAGEKIQASPCRFIPLNDKGETIDYFYRCRPQADLEEAFAPWLRNQVSQIEEHTESASTTAREHTGSASSNLDRLRRKQWLAFAGNLYALANRHRENQNYSLAYALYGRALAAAGRVPLSADDVVALVAKIRHDQRTVFEILHYVQEAGTQASPEELQMVG
jgi:hypothetical protein